MCLAEGQQNFHERGERVGKELSTDYICHLSLDIMKALATSNGGRVS